MRQPTFFVALSLSAAAACSDDGLPEPEPQIGHPLLYDRASCEAELSTSVLEVFGLDDGRLGIESLSVVRPSGAYASGAEAVAALSFAPSPGPLEKAFGVGSLELWQARSGDIGAIAWVDTALAEVVYSGSVLGLSGGPSQRPPEDASVAVGDAPLVRPSFAIAPNPDWTDSATLAQVILLGTRSEAVARYRVCGDATFAAYVYTPAILATDEAKARGLVIVSGHRATERVE